MKRVCVHDGLNCLLLSSFRALSAIISTLNNITLAHFNLCVCLPSDQAADPSMEEASDEGLLLQAGLLISGHGGAPEPGRGD